MIFLIAKIYLKFISLPVIFLLKRDNDTIDKDQFLLLPMVITDLPLPSNSLNS